jgi:hypothetical protein
MSPPQNLIGAMGTRKLPMSVSQQSAAQEAFRINVPFFAAPRFFG